MSYSRILEHAIESLNGEGRHNQADILRDVLQSYNKRGEQIEAAVVALRAVTHDRPTAHTDEVWELVLATLNKLGG